MTLLAAPLLLAAAIDGAAAHTHAARLAALGPHPFGSPRAAVAAEYVAAAFRSAGLENVRLQGFSDGRTAGSNVIGVLPGPGRETLVIGAHHDSAAESPGAYDDGSGVGILIETARALAAAPGRNRTVVFVSFEGGTAGSRAYVKSLGADLRNVVAAVVVEMSGWQPGAPNLQAVPEPDAFRAGRYLIAPGWLVQAVLDGSRSGKAKRLAVGDPYIPWLYQAAVRTYRMREHTDSAPFLQAGTASLFLTDSSLSRYYPYHRGPRDTADKLDDQALAKVGNALVGAVRALSEARQQRGTDPHWFAAFGHVFGALTLYFLGGALIIAALQPVLGTSALALGARLAVLLAFGWLLFVNPVSALWVFALPLGAAALDLRRRFVLLAFMPAVLLLVTGIVSWNRGFISGTWYATWEVAMMAAMAMALLGFAGPTARGARRTRSRAGGSGRSRGKAAGRKTRRRGLADRS